MILVNFEGKLSKMSIFQEISRTDFEVNNRRDLYMINERRFNELNHLDHSTNYHFLELHFG